MGISTLQESSNTGTISLEEIELFRELEPTCEVCLNGLTLKMQAIGPFPARWIATAEAHNDCENSNKRYLICDMHKDINPCCNRCDPNWVEIRWTIIEPL